MINYRPIESEDLDCNILDGRYIKDKDSKEKVMVVAYVENYDEPYSEAILDHDYLDYGDRVDEYMLLRNFEIEV